jgi:hypothetical protein
MRSQKERGLSACACTVTLVDRRVHRSEILEIEGDSSRLKEAKERRVSKQASHRGKRASA